MQKRLTSFSIKDWPDDDRPRKKMLLKGRDSLSDAELVAILIGSGNKEDSAVSLSKKILAAANNDLGELGAFSVEQFQKFKGIGEAKAVTISAAMELSKRRRDEGATRIIKITDSKAVNELLRGRLGELPHEEFWIVYLNNSNKVLRKVRLSKGGITGTVVDVRLAMKKALELGATALILVHNHPSGTLKPSLADKLITTKLKSASKTLDIKVLDHIIISKNGYYSFADNALL